MTIIIVLGIIALIIYYLAVILNFFTTSYYELKSESGMYRGKKAFLLDLIPFYGLVRIFRERWRNLN